MTNSDLNQVNILTNQKDRKVLIFQRLFYIFVMCKQK